ncbi:TniQ family protein [Pseudomonas fluorescens]|uniref:TniQ domain-containing protein n=1 Tax=Pseudomonas fluorescens TaxID=294 RepID=A0A5E7SC19_PSEFL|nr:TniQ family protein [Pseudomonas fluorescens]VVP84252.1 hypothetical protein PS922_02114 [Pseudomonas fluorescens]
MHELPFWPRPYPHESPSSLVSRTAFLNGYTNVMSFSRALGVDAFISFKNLFEGEVISDFFLKNDENPFASQSVFYKRSSPLATGLRNTIIAKIEIPFRKCRHHPRFCPACLAEGYWRFIQDIDYVAVCPYHHLFYLSNCPSCDRLYQWSYTNGPFCKCQFDLRNALAIPTQDTATIRLLELFLNLNQDAITRTFAAFDCMQFKLLSDPDTNCAISIAVNIGIKEKNFFKTYLSHLANTYPNFPTQTLLTPWIHSHDQWISNTALDYFKYNSLQPHTCAVQNCCKSLAFTFAELKSSFGTVGALETTRSIIKNNSFQKIRFANRIFYHKDQMCKIINKFKQERTRGETPTGYTRKDYESTHKIQSNWGILPHQVEELVSNGFIPGEIILGKNTRGKTRAKFIHIDCLKLFAKKFTTTPALSREFGISGKAIKSILIKNNIIPPHDNFPYLYYRKQITPDIKKSIESRHDDLKILRARKKYTIWEFASLIHIKRKTIIQLIQSNVIPQLTSQYNAKTNYFTDPDAALKLLMEWRKDHFTHYELATKLDTNACILRRRFEVKDNTKPLFIGNQKFYSTSIAKEIEHQLKVYIPQYKAWLLANLTSGGLKRLTETKIIRPIPSDHPAYCPSVKLYCLSDILSISDNLS